jgi:hypothetical protein
MLYGRYFNARKPVNGQNKGDTWNKPSATLVVSYGGTVRLRGIFSAEQP